jgi:hypothetical protein
MRRKIEILVNNVVIGKGLGKVIRRKYMRLLIEISNYK